MRSGKEDNGKIATSYRDPKIFVHAYKNILITDTWKIFCPLLHFSNWDPRHVFQDRTCSHDVYPHALASLNIPLLYL